MDEEDQNLRPVTIALLMVAVILTLWGGYFFLVLTRPEITLWTGTFGDAFGALNTLFAGLAFGGVIFTIILQSRELALQRKELHDTRQVMKEQGRNFEKQLLDDSFYQQVRLYNENVNVLRSEISTDIPQQGRDAIANILVFFWRRVEHGWVIQQRKNAELPPEQVPSGWQMNTIVNAYYATVWPLLSHVIQSFVAIAELIESTDHETQTKYARFFWAQFSVAERQLFRIYVVMPRVSGTTIRMLEGLDMIDTGPWSVRDDIEKVLRDELKTIKARVSLAAQS